MLKYLTLILCLTSTFAFCENIPRPWRPFSDIIQDMKSENDVLHQHVDGELGDICQPFSSEIGKLILRGYSETSNSEIIIHASDGPGQLSHNLYIESKVNDLHNKDIRNISLNIYDENRCLIQVFKMKRIIGNSFHFSCKYSRKKINDFKYFEIELANI